MAKNDWFGWVAIGFGSLIGYKMAKQGAFGAAAQKFVIDMGKTLSGTAGTFAGQTPPSASPPSGGGSAPPVSTPHPSGHFGDAYNFVAPYDNGFYVMVGGNQVTAGSDLPNGLYSSQGAAERAYNNAGGPGP